MSATNNKKIVFVNPPLSISRRYGYLGYAGGNEPPIGLCYLAAAVRKKGFGTAIIDAQATGLNLNRTISLIISYRPTYVGITAATMAIKSAYELALGIKKIDPTIKIIIGGCHVSSLPKETLEECRSFDVGVIGEGEDTIVELIQALDKDEDLSVVKGIVSRQDKDIRLSPPRNRIKDLDSLPYPAFDLLPDIKKCYRLPAQNLAGGYGFSLISSRGCFGKCLFCDKKVFGDHITMHSAEYITEMACILNKDYDITEIMFEDDNFMISKERLELMVSLFKKRQLKFKWSVLARVDSVDGESLRIAKAGGCWRISYGIESGCQRILDFYEKGITISQIKNAIDLTKKAGLKIKCFFMWGNPFEDKNSVQDTSEFIKGLGIDDVSITFFTPYPGSKIWKDISSYGRLDNDAAKMSCFELVFRPFGLTDDYLISTRKKTLRDFYLRPKVFFSYLRRIRSMRLFKQLLLSAWCLFCYVFKRK